VQNPSLGTTITLNEIGLSNEKGQVPFDFDTQSIHHGTASESVSVTTLDEYLSTHGIDQVDVLKLDVEGHEPQALEGAQATLSDHRIKAIVIETIVGHGPLGRARRLLAQAGYTKVPMPDPRPAFIQRLRPLQDTENTAYEPIEPPDWQ
jgi:hypothetical protein